MGLDVSGHEAKSYGRIRLEIRIAPRSSDHPQSRRVDIVLAIDWLTHLHRLSLDEMRLTHFVVC